MRAHNHSVEVIRWGLGDRPRKKKAAKPHKKRKVARAITSGYFATICDGRRIVRHYYSGQPLQGTIQ